MSFPQGADPAGKTERAGSKGQRGGKDGGPDLGRAEEVVGSCQIRGEP